VAAGLLLVLAAGRFQAQGVRDHTRLAPNRSTVVTDSQATELTLTLTEVAVRPIQVWIRTAGQVDASKKVVTASVSPGEAEFIRVGQRVRAFAPESRSRMSQARISQVTWQGDRAVVAATLLAVGLQESSRYVLEIVTERGDFLSVPNEAILEAGGIRRVYVQDADGGYAPREIRVGWQGELFTQVLEGLNPGEQVVTTGSFFIDAEHRLKGP
jgi:hypothetical protein